MAVVSILTQERQPGKWEIINYAATEEELARGRDEAIMYDTGALPSLMRDCWQHRTLPRE